MAFRLSKKEIEERSHEGYTEEAKILKRLGEDEGKKLIEKISFGKTELKNNWKEFVTLRFSKEKDEADSTPYYVIRAINEKGKAVGQLNYKLDKMVDLSLLIVDTDIENRQELGEEMIRQLEEVSSLVGAGCINGRYYPCFKGEFKFEELFQKLGYSLEKTGGRWNELWKKLPEKQNTDESENNI